MQFKQVGSLGRTNSSAQGGFTLIELIVVIVILGILAATALPRFTDLGADARLAKVQGARGAVSSAASMAHGSWLAQGSTGSVTAEGTTILMSAAGFPTAANIQAAAGLADYNVTVASGVATIASDSSHTTCSFTYTETTGCRYRGTGKNGLLIRQRDVTMAINPRSPANRLPGACAGQFGFTLVELIMVIVLVGILGAVAAPRFFSRTTFDASGYSNQMATLVRYGQKLAIAQNRSVFVRLDGNSVALCYSATCAAGSRVIAPAGTNSGAAATRQRCIDPATSVFDERWACEGVPGGVTMTNAGTFYFDAVGTPFATTDAQPTLVSTFPTTLAINVTGAGVTLRTTVEGGTGYVH